MKGTRRNFLSTFLPQSRKKTHLGLIFSHAFIATVSDTAPLKLKVKWDCSVTGHAVSLGSFRYSVRFSPWTSSDSSGNCMCGHHILLIAILLLSSQGVPRHRSVRKKGEDDGLLGTEWITCLSIHIKFFQMVVKGQGVAVLHTSPPVGVPSPKVVREEKAVTLWRNARKRQLVFLISLICTTHAHLHTRPCRGGKRGPWN